MHVRNTGKFIVCFILCILTIALTACGYTVEEIKKMREYEKTAENNAIAYIEEKYGFTPYVEKVKCEKYNMSFVMDPSPGPTGYVYVELLDKKNHTNFWVYTTGEGQSSQECWDNYQQEEIEEAAQYQLEALLGIETEHIDLAYGRFGEIGKRSNTENAVDMQYGLIHDYFDGTNLSEILANAECNKMVACMIDTDYIPQLLGCAAGELTEDGIYKGVLTKNDALVQKFGENIEYFFINYNDSKGYDCAHNDGCMTSFVSPLNSCSENMSIFIKDHYYVAARSRDGICTEYSRYEAKKYDDFYYIAMGGTYCNFAEADTKIAYDNWWNGIAQKVFGAYSVDSDARCVYVFIPLSCLEVADVTEYMVEKRNITIADRYYYEDEDNKWILSRSSCLTDVVGDSAMPDTEKYLTATIYLHDFRKDIIFSVFMDEK